MLTVCWDFLCNLLIALSFGQRFWLRAAFGTGHPDLTESSQRPRMVRALRSLTSRGCGLILLFVKLKWDSTVSFEGPYQQIESCLCLGRKDYPNVGVRFARNGLLPLALDRYATPTKNVLNVPPPTIFCSTVLASPDGGIARGLFLHTPP